MICNCGNITTKLTYFWECQKCGRTDVHTKFPTKRKPVMRDRTKIHRILKNSTTLNIVETEFLMKIKYMLFSSKDDSISEKQSRWVRNILNRERNNY
jgi:hypothetical protein